MAHQGCPWFVSNHMYSGYHERYGCDDEEFHGNERSGDQLSCHGRFSPMVTFQLIQAQLDRALRWVGRVVVGAPRSSISIAIAVCGLCSLGLLRISFQNDPTILLSSANNAAARQWKQYTDHFDNLNVIGVVLARKGHGDIIHSVYLTRMFDLEQELRAINVTTDISGTTIGYNDFCIRLLDTDKQMSCFVNSATQYWPNRDAVEADPNLYRTLSGFKRTFCGQIMNVSNTVGGIQRNDVQLITRAHSLQLSMMVNLNHPLIKEGNVFEQWEAKVIQLLKAYQEKWPDCELGWLTPNAIKMELNTDFGESAIALVLSAISIIVVTILALAQSLPTWRERVIVGLSGLGITTLSLFAGLGFISLSGYPINPLSFQVLPFFAFGIGIDNVFYLSTLYSRLLRTGAKRETVIETVSQGGYAIISNMVMMNVIFAILLIFEMNVIMTLCIMNITILSISALLQLFVLCPVLLLVVRPSDRPAENRTLAVTTRIYTNLLSNTHSLNITATTTILILALSAFAVSLIQVDLPVPTLFPATSPLAAYYRILDQDYDTKIPTFIPLEHVDFTDPAVQRQAMDLTTQLAALKDDVASVTSWIANFFLWVRYRAPAASGYADTFLANGETLPADVFMRALNEFLLDRDNGGMCHTVDVQRGAGNASVVQSQIMVSLQKASNAVALVKGFDAVEDVLRGNTLGGYVANGFYPIVSGFRPLTMQFALSFSIALVCLIALNLVCYPIARLSMVNVACVALMEVTYMGTLPLMGIQINPITIANAVITLGAAIEYSGYMSKTFFELAMKGERSVAAYASAFASIALNLSSSSVCNVVSLLLLLSAKTPLVYIYFFRMYMMLTVLVYIYTVIVYPMVLYRYGFSTLKHGLPVEMSESKADIVQAQAKYNVKETDAM